MKSMISHYYQNNIETFKANNPVIDAVPSYSRVPNICLLVLKNFCSIVMSTEQQYCATQRRQLQENPTSEHYQIIIQMSLMLPVL